jgi:hypothetical protein
MGIYRELLTFRPLMPVSRLYEIIDPKWRAPANGKMTINGCFNLRIDVDDMIGEVAFTEGFPKKPIEGLVLGMPMAKVLSAQSFTTDRDGRLHASLASGNKIIAQIRDDLLWHITIYRPGRLYHPDAKFIDRTMVVTKGLHRDIGADEALREWAWECSDFIVDDYVEWLMHASAEERHYAALNWNYDNGSAPLWWIIQQPDCEMATALAIFFAYDHFYYYDALISDTSPLEREDETNLLREIRRKFCAGFYKSSTIYFDGTEYYGNGPVRPEIAKAVPEVMRREVGHLSLPDSAMLFADGYPVHIL